MTVVTTKGFVRPVNIVSAICEKWFKKI